jgi:serine/threonine protein kinase
VTPAPTPPPGATPADEPRTIAEPRQGQGAALPVGQALQEYVIEGLVGEGGFGIVYLARDTRLDRKVALKEYMPTNLAQRGSDRTVTVRSERYRETFVLGLRSFVNEAKLLASFDHPSLVKVYRFWEENGTAYMVMPFYEGPTLRQKLNELGQPPDEAWLRALLAPMIDALELIHNDHCWHRDIAPDNILLLAPSKTQAGPAPQLRPLLLDFGAARRVIGDVTHNLTVILKPGYAPLEQYAESDSMKQGPWTDVYALCAVLYCAVTGRAPVPSVSRVLSDDMVSAVQAGAGRYSHAFLAAIDTGLAVRPDARPPSMAALREQFDLSRTRAAQHAAQPRRAGPAEGALGNAGVAAQSADAPVARSNSAPAAPGRADPASGPRDERDHAGAGGAPKWPLILACFVALVVAAAAFGWWLQRSTAPKRASQPSMDQPAPQLAQPEAPKSVPQPAPSNAPASAIATSVAPADAPASAAAVAVPTAVPAPAPTAAPTLPATARASAPTSTASVRPPAPRPAVVAAPARPPPPAVAEPAPLPSAAAAPAQPALDPKRFECEVLVRAGQKALTNRSYDDAMQRADEARAVYPDCPGAAELGRTARQAKDRARSSAVIQ